ncbi:RNA-directed DNA polymerase, eukaryota [Tanacetum coccineum]
MYWIRANETQGWVPEFTDEYESEDDNSMDEEGEVKKNGIKDEHSDGEIVPESLFEDGELENNHVDGIFSKKEKEVSEDPFNLYSLLKRQNKLDDKDTNSEDSLKHPPGFTPLTHNCENDTSEKKVDQNDEFSEAGDVDKLKGSANGSISAGHFKVSEIPRTGGSMVGLLEDVIKVGQVMGFKMEGVIANLEELIGTQGGKEVIQETKMEKIEDFCVKQCWGNSVFDYVYSEAVGNSGGKWRLTGKNMMIIGVYAPQEGKEKQALWDFLRFEVDKWNGDVIIMGDFNEVRVKSDRFGTHFNPHGAHRFNSFILDSGLVEVNLGGCRFTWCHRSATKMSKLDRFLVSESVISGSPNIKAVTLERFLSKNGISIARMVQEVNICIPSPVIVKDKDKGKMEESEDEQTKRTKLQQEQERLGHEAAVRRQEELDEEERQRMARVHEVGQYFTEEEWENIRARVEVDEELSKKLQVEERNKYSEVDQAKMLVDLINQRKKYFAAHKAEAKRNKPMTQAQQRNYMINYIKHMGSHTL